MSVSITSRTPLGWISHQPYVLLTLPALFWAGNAIVGRAAAGHIPPFTLSFLRWTLAFVVLLPFAWRALKQDWPVIRAHLGFMVFISLISIGLFNSLQYLGLVYTTALNSLLLQSSGPLFVAIWSLLLFGIRLTAAQAIGILVSMIGVLVILLHGDLAALASIELNKGDLLFLTAMAIFGLYAALIPKRPPMQQLSFLGFTFGCGALGLIPPFIWEFLTRPHAEISAATLGSLVYVALFPSVLAYLCYNRGIQLIGANRSAPFFHLIPVFGSAMAIFLLGEQLHPFHVVGYVLVLCGIVVAARKQKLPAVAVAEVPPT
jgi:drug/metabolite transporter (DMT)-like permease